MYLFRLQDQLIVFSAPVIRLPRQWDAMVWNLRSWSGTGQSREAFRDESEKKQAQPHTAFLEIQDYNTLTPKQQTDALDFILNDEATAQSP